MHAIVFDEDKDWWVQGWIFDRLLQAVEARGGPSYEVTHRLKVAEANYFLDVRQLEQPLRHDLVQVLHDAASSELLRLGSATSGQDASYRVDLERLVELASMELSSRDD
jgi:hypothetical protein